MTGYRVWWIVNPPNDASYYDVNSPKEGKKVLDELYKKADPDDWCIGGLEELDELDGLWYEWYNDCADDVNDADFSEE